MDANFKTYLSNILNTQIEGLQPISGGDISSAFVISTINHSYFLKINSSENALQLFQSEVNGLKSIQSTNTISTPKVFHCDIYHDYAFLVLEYIETKSATNSDFELLGTQLADLHNSFTEDFGLDQNNFIGNLPQSNATHETWVEFYIKERLKPQLDLAVKKNLLKPSEYPSENRIFETLELLLNNLKPSLLHGDLWSGNYLISKDGIPYLIDPAVYYGHNEVDIAMTKLFGGFGNSFYQAYYSIHPTNEYSNARMDIYQLYYLLVHLNLFGSSYHASVINILKKHF
ncbi:fructosamine kinase family protein [Gaetbulibacter saemankumensis]|uniref:fructosamine kinase family protein n=1 Tax=Gaetbulibacter saemankumensis TaxID=311208 RepID=UPI000402A5DA|nr:fructosamine kinase family protein [Gaetbulibacter saemankumensis]